LSTKRLLNILARKSQMSKPIISSELNEVCQASQACWEKSRAAPGEAAPLSSVAKYALPTDCIIPETPPHRGVAILCGTVVRAHAVGRVLPAARAQEGG
jgi:hypothetical protein